MLPNRLLRCSHVLCQSYDLGQHMFNTMISVDEHRHFVDNWSKIPASQYECAFCGKPAIYVQEE